MIVAIEITVLTHPLSIYHLVLVLAFGRQGTSAIEVITMIAHPLCIVLHIRMRAPSHRLLGPIPFLF